MLAVDQDGVAARRIRNVPTEQIFAKRERGGDVIVGLFNTSTANPEEISIEPSAIGLPGGLCGSCPREPMGTWDQQELRPDYGYCPSGERSAIQSDSALSLETADRMLPSPPYDFELPFDEAFSSNGWSRPFNSAHELWAGSCVNGQC
jgi:hypothetical protein